MYKVILQSGEYQLPESWQEVTFDQLIKMKSANLGEANGNILATSLALSALMGCDHKEIMKLDSESFVQLAEASKWIHNFDVKHEFKREFEFDGIKYKLVENFNNLSIGEMASIEQLVMEDSEKNADKILAILIREALESGDIAPFDPSSMESRANILRMNLTIPQVHALNAFFLDGAKISTKDTQGFLENQNQTKVQILKM